MSSQIISFILFASCTFLKNYRDSYTKVEILRHFKQQSREYFYVSKFLDDMLR